MRVSSLFSASQKVAIKKIVLPLMRCVTRTKKINTQYHYIEFSNFGCHTYFGYYDVSPFQDNRVIYLERKRSSDVCNIVINDINNTSKQYVADSRAWNWQQGIRLRWFPNTKNTISFNDFIDGKYINRIINLETKEEKRIDWALYDIDSNGKYGITLDFSRLGVMRPGYGYTCEPYVAGNLWEDGISIIDIEKNELVKTITYKELSDNIKTVDDVNHFYLNHLSFSPDGTKFLFFWIDEDKGFHQASLGVYDLISGELIPLEIEGKASHYVWDGNYEIICTILDRKYRAKYCRFNLVNRSKRVICEDILYADGHPSVFDKGMIVTDTYPDTRGFQHIYLVNENDGSKTELINIYSVPTYNIEKRTDLHPRLSEDKRFLSFDSSHGSFRRMMLLSLD